MDTKHIKRILAGQQHMRGRIAEPWASLTLSPIQRVTDNRTVTPSRRPFRSDFNYQTKQIEIKYLNSFKHNNFETWLFTHCLMGSHTPPRDRCHCNEMLFMTLMYTFIRVKKVCTTGHFISQDIKLTEDLKWFQLTYEKIEIIISVAYRTLKPSSKSPDVKAWQFPCKTFPILWSSKTHREFCF